MDTSRAAFGVRFVDRHQETVLDEIGGLGIRAGQRKIDADGDRLADRERRMATSKTGQGGPGQQAERRTTVYRIHCMSPGLRLRVSALCQGSAPSRRSDQIVV